MRSASPPSIGLVCPYSFAHPGGVQNHVLGVGGWLKSQGHRVHLMGPGRPDREALERNGLDGSEFTSAGPAIPVPYNGSVARVNFGWLESRRVRRWLRQCMPDVLHVHEPITPSVSLLSVWAQHDIPVVATFHTATPGSRTMALAQRLLPETIAGIDRGIAVSSVARQVVRDHVGLDPQVIGNGIHLVDEPADLRRTTWRGGAQPRITFVGRYDEPRKGFEVFVEALPLLRARYPRADFVVVGEGAARSLPGVRFVGYLSDPERDQLLAQSDVYVAPHTGRESFGIVIVEALSAGADVVASDLAAFREVMTDADGELVGSLARVGDPVDLAAQVIATLSHPDPERRRRARHHAATFDWSVIGPRVAEVYAAVRTT
ncbi:glycosyltransferase family 4 protein [Aestuariimicrobium sp. p3-SID1156]|uniref:glycosyltransferase family 4 protein n=1 Tax=Aestuariimicrobium sp. p3-SID1156 TaxID=2916038 RepID=UPI00223B074D|nr:glycosyltransferase family 4 protein [Aestuariimicrobium sp. p3-SID1156]MCT1459015.1 glycosyltransferase family 4 protein [Aestuariimicrobium sp. p3-SID1156]